MFFVCSATGINNCQIIEGKDTSAVFEGFQHLFCEVTMPKVILPDADGALLKACKGGEMDVEDLSGKLSRE